MTDEVLLMGLITIVALYAGYLVNKWKISDLEDRIERLERKHE